MSLVDRYAVLEWVPFPFTPWFNVSWFVYVNLLINESNAEGLLMLSDISFSFLFLFI